MVLLLLLLLFSFFQDYCNNNFIVNTVYGAYLPRSYVGSDGIVIIVIIIIIIIIITFQFLPRLLQQ